jgi:hypothetical protein
MLVTVVVNTNAALQSLAGLGHLRATPSVTITGNPSLTQWGGLLDLEECSGSITVAGNEKLTELGLPVLDAVGALYVTGQPLLANGCRGSAPLDGLERPTV